MDKITELNCETGEVIERDLTPAEIAQRKIDADYVITRAKEIAEAEAAKAALLVKLGITADEAKLLVS
jgi:hypothetical protein